MFNDPPRVTLTSPNWVEVIQVPAGSQISARSNDSSGGILNVTELSNKQPPCTYIEQELFAGEPSNI